MTFVNLNQPIPVKIGEMTLYCEKMNLSAKTVLYCTPTLTGVPVRTNKCRQPTHLTFSGRVYEPERPMFLALMMNNMNGRDGLEVIYRDMRFINCTVTGVKAEDSGKDYIDVTVTLSTLTMGYV